MVKSGAREEAAGAAVNTERAGTRRGIRLDGLTEMHNISASISADATNMIETVRFATGNQYVDKLTAGTAFQIWVGFKATIAYIRARTPNPPAYQGPWGCFICAINAHNQFAASGWWEAKLSPLSPFLVPSSISDQAFRLGDNPYSAFGYTNNLVMPAEDIVFVVHLIGSAANNLDPPTPDELMSMNVQ